jgi:hypothetical protein
MDPWKETYVGGSPAEEAKVVNRLAAEIMQVQAWLKQKNHATTIRRGFHAKLVAAVMDAEFRISADLPEEFRVGYLRPGTSYRTTVRFSNAAGAIQKDSQRDMRGAALRVHISAAEVHDLLMTNGPASHARNARQFITFARAMAGSKLLLLPRLVFGVGPFETIRMFRNILSVTAHPVRSLASERFWSRAPVKCGTTVVKFRLVPAAGADPGPDPDSKDPDYLHAEMAARLRRGTVAFDFQVQKYVDERKTPVEDGSVEWREADSPPLTIAQLVIPQQDLDSAAGIATARAVDDLEFNPWHTTEDFRPVGNLNRARQLVYTASVDHRMGYRFYRSPNKCNAFFGGLTRRFFMMVNRFVPWHRLPSALGSLNLMALRQVMRRQNIYDTEDYPELPFAWPTPRSLPGVAANGISPQPAALGPGPFLPAPPAAAPTTADPVLLTARSGDVPYNDLADPPMGGVSARFGRNVPLDRAMPQAKLFLEPNPRVVSQVLLTRDVFKPVKTLNVLAAAWIQFMIHGWFDHERHNPGEKDLLIPVRSDDPWPERPMKIPATVEAAPARQNPPRPPAYRNTETSWWDGSQIYGSRNETTNRLRARVDGKMKLGADGLLPLDPVLPGIDQTGFNNNWWLGLSVLHTLFCKEHNAICEALHREYPAMDDDQLFAKARLINCALMGKIHTVEWTPGILANPVLQQGMQIVWSGAPNDWLTRLGIWLVEAESLHGVPGSLPVHHAARYCNTEEFVAVYKMHPLMPDDFHFVAHADGHLLGDRTLTQIQGRFTREALTTFSMSDLLYSFGVAYPGAITLHNYPRTLQQLVKLDGSVIDLATADIVRERERGVPRYNDFRELLHMPRIKSWNKLSANPRWAAELKEVYGHIDRVDTMVGMFAETPPPGFGFSDTTFHIFVLTATRRIQSDRFFTVDYTPDVYTPLGLRWVAENGMKTVVLRHHPELQPFVQHLDNVFAPWKAHPVA